MAADFHMSVIPAITEGARLEEDLVHAAEMPELKPMSLTMVPDMTESRWQLPS